MRRRDGGDQLRDANGAERRDLTKNLARLEDTREMVLGSFALYMTGTARNTNNFVKPLTLVTVLVGLLGVIAGVMGMSFEAGFFKYGMSGFLLVIAGMAGGAGRRHPGVGVAAAAV